MKLVPYEKRSDDEVPAPIPEVPAELYGELFLAANWAILSKPWEKASSDSLFELGGTQESDTWRGFLEGDSLSVFRLVRVSSQRAATKQESLEVHFIASDFLQGHDYELNVRYAPEAWDECERDVIVLRAVNGDREPDHPNPEQVSLLTAGLKRLKETQAEN